MWRKGDRETAAFGVAEDIVMQQNLDVGDFENNGVQFSKVFNFVDNGRKSQKSQNLHVEGQLGSGGRMDKDDARRGKAERNLGNIKVLPDAVAPLRAPYSLDCEGRQNEIVLNYLRTTAYYVTCDYSHRLISQ